MSSCCTLYAQAVSFRSLEGLSESKNEQIGHVHSVFERTVNVFLYKNRQIISAHNDKIGFTPLSLELGEQDYELFSRGLTADTPVYAAGGRGFTVNGITVDISRAVMVNCRKRALELDEKGRNILLDACRKYIAGEYSDAETELYEKLQREFGRLKEAMLAQNAEQIQNSAQNIIGLGYGLTPSGDDMLCGFLACMSAMGHELPGQCVAWLLEHSAGSTTQLSAEFFRCFFEGQYLPPVNGLLLSASIYDDRRCEKYAQELSKMGSSSGKDYLTGIKWAVSLP